MILNKKKKKTYGRIFDAGDNTSSQNEFLPGLDQIDDVNTIVAAFVDIGSHLGIQIQRSNVRVGDQELLNIIFLESQSGRNLRHLV
jgi:hypothetical protein